MAKFTLEINLDNAAWRDDDYTKVDPRAIVDALVAVSEDLVRGQMMTNVIRDANGNVSGHFRIEVDRDETEPEKDDDDFGEFFYWETYSKRGNDLMQAMFEKLIADLRSGDVTRNDLPAAINDRLNSLNQLEPGQGYWDTEPQSALAMRLNPVLDELGYKSISRWDW